jgi:hypothetical protein
VQELTFTEHEYDGTEAARFVATRPDGSTLQTDPLGRELWSVSADGNTYDQIKTDAFYVETLDDFRTAVFEIFDKEEEAIRKIDEDRLKEEAARRKLQREQTIKAIKEISRACYQIGSAVWQITCFLVMITMVIGTFLITVMGIVCMIPLWFTGACLRGGWKMK